MAGWPVLLKIVYLLTWRVLGVAVLVFRVPTKAPIGAGRPSTPK